VTPAHVIAWRDDVGERTLGGTTIRHQLAALSSLFQYLCDKNAVTHNPVKGVKRPKNESDEGKNPALGDHQARKLLVAPDEETLKGIRESHHSGHPALPCPPARGTVQAEGKGLQT
jgi:integrase/recombinase XerD